MSRRESYASTSSVPSTTSTPQPDSAPPSPAPENTALFSRFVYPADPIEPLSRSKSTEHLPVVEKPPLPRIASNDLDVRIKRSNSASQRPLEVAHSASSASPRRRATTFVSSMPGHAPVTGKSRNTPAKLDHPYIPLPTPSRWRFIPSFLSSNNSTASNVTPVATSPPELPARPPRKGDVVCLSYATLDDRGMRRLEGRSDHRPVIGSYAVYF